MGANDHRRFHDRWAETPIGTLSTLKRNSLRRGGRIIRDNSLAIARELQEGIYTFFDNVPYELYYD